MKPIGIALVLTGLAAPLAFSQHTFTGTGNWLDPGLWDTGVIPPDASTAIVNGDALVDQNVAPSQTLNPGRVEIGNGTSGSVTVTGGTLSGAHGGASGGIFVGLNGGTGTLTVAEGATYRSQGANMRVRIGDDFGGSGTISVAGVLLNFKILEIVDGTLEMLPTGQSNVFNENNPSFIGPNGTLAFVIDGSDVGALERSNTNGLHMTIDAAATLKVTLGGTFALNDSWVLMDYTSLNGQFAQGTSFTNEQGYTFAVDYGSGTSDVVTLTLTSDALRPKIDAITATPASISAGGTSTLNWTASNFDTLTLDPGGIDVSTLDSSTVMPAATTTYTLSAALGAVTVARDVTVVVDELPEINSFAAAETIIAPGESTTLSWDVSGATSVTISPAPGNVGLVDSAAVTPATTTTYKLTATNATGPVMEELTVTVDALEAALIHRWDPAAPGQTSGAFLDPVGGKNFDMTGGNLITGLSSEGSSLTAAMSRVNPAANTGGDNGLGFPATDTTYELWVRTAGLDANPQTIFETGSPDNGTCILISEFGVRFMHSVAGTTTIDIEAPVDFVNTGDDFIQIVASIDGVAEEVNLSIRGAGGGSESVSGSGAMTAPNGRASIFTWSGFGGGAAGSLGGVGAVLPDEVRSFAGSIGLFHIYDRPLTAAEADEAFLRIGNEITTSDSDGDNLPDWWELRYFPDLSRGFNAQSDSDTLSDGDEFDIGTNPSLADSDGDGLNDDEELDLPFPSDPTNPDTDGDFLSDGAEVNGDPYTDPTLEDTDFDGFWDGYELCLGSDPDDQFDLPADDVGEPYSAIHVAGTYSSFDASMGGLVTEDASFRMFVDFDEKLGGEREVLFETGGAGTGISLAYEAGNQLVFRASGGGGFVLSTVSHTLTTAQLGAGELDVICAFDVDDGSLDFLSVISLFIDGVLVGSRSADLGGSWSGTNNAAFAVASGNMAGNGDNTPLTGVDFTSGTIDFMKGLAYYELLHTAPGLIRISDITRLPGTNEVTITFDSGPGKTYTISKSTNLVDFTEVQGGINSGGASTTSPAIAAPDAAASSACTKSSK